MSTVGDLQFTAFTIYSWCFGGVNIGWGFGAWGVLGLEIKHLRGSLAQEQRHTGAHD